MDIAVIDIVFVVIIAVFTLRCAVRGFVSELMSMAALIGGLLTAIFFFRRGADIVRDRLLPGIKILPEIIAFILLFLIVFGVIKMFEIMLKEIIEGIQFGGADRFLGIIFGFGEGLVFVCLLLFVINTQPFFNPWFLLRGSFFAEKLMPFIFGNKREALDSVVWLTKKMKGGG